MERTAKTNKILLLGVDGMDPRLTKKYVSMGLMPNTKKYIEAGAQRKDLVMLGGHPTVTPPMWTTLAAGCYANVHGITGFFRKGNNLDELVYNLDSRLCKAEPLWNCFAEAGWKTLVWHWPGSSWPPTSDSENLFVVDGTSPGSVGMAVAQTEPEFLLEASIDIPVATFKTAAIGAAAACVVNDLELDTPNSAAVEGDSFSESFSQGMVTKELFMDKSQMPSASTENKLSVAVSPIKEASGWAFAPAEAKEFTLLLSKGLLRRPGLILKNEKGDYDRVAIYKSKKSIEPIVILPKGQMVAEIVDESIKGNVKFDKTNRNMKLLELDPCGNYLKLYISAAMDMTNDSVWHPKRIFKSVAENVGYTTPTSMVGCQDPLLITECMLANWYVTADWQANAIIHLIESENLDIVFSHFHAVDLQSHMFIKHMADRPFNKQPVDVADQWMQDVYVQTDYYLGKFLHLLDENWTVMIFSDHAQVASAHDIPYLGGMGGVNVRVMQQLGFTVLKTDENGKELAEIDWSKTRAVAQREQHIYLNLKGRDPYGIVDPKDQYELEEEIMTALYGYKDAKTGHRIVSVALRNRDAVLLGQGGLEAGDICYWLAEGYNYDHADCLATAYGEGDTSVSPIFIAAGKGLKKGYTTDRIIRQIDLAPTVAFLGGVRTPRECEGAPIYQIFEKDI